MKGKPLAAAQPELNKGGAGHRIESVQTFRFERLQPYIHTRAILIRVAGLDEA